MMIINVVQINQFFKLISASENQITKEIIDKIFKFFKLSNGQIIKDGKFRNLLISLRIQKSTNLFTKIQHCLFNP